MFENCGVQIRDGRTNEGLQPKDQWYKLVVRTASFGDLYTHIRWAQPSPSYIPINSINQRLTILLCSTFLRTNHAKEARNMKIQRPTDEAEGRCA